jgi:hypothetical protein
MPKALSIDQFETLECEYVSNTKYYDGTTHLLDR